MITTNGIFLIDNTNRMLLVHATNGRWNHWSIPKGVGDIGESSIDAAFRELNEETNVDLYKLMKQHGYEYHYLGIKPYKSGKKQLEGHLFKIKSNLSEQELDLKCESMITDTNTPECDKFEWYDIPEALKTIHSAQAELLKEHITLT